MQTLTCYVAGVGIVTTVNFAIFSEWCWWVEWLSEELKPATVTYLLQYLFNKILAVTCSHQIGVQLSHHHKYRSLLLFTSSLKPKFSVPEKRMQTMWSFLYCLLRRQTQHRICTAGVNMQMFIVSIKLHKAPNTSSLRACDRGLYMPLWCIGCLCVAFCLFLFGISFIVILLEPFVNLLHVCVPFEWLCREWHKVNNGG